MSVVLDKRPQSSPPGTKTDEGPIHFEVGTQYFSVKDITLGGKREAEIKPSPEIDQSKPLTLSQLAAPNSGPAINRVMIPIKLDLNLTGVFPYNPALSVSLYEPATIEFPKDQLILGADNSVVTNREIETVFPRGLIFDAEGNRTLFDRAPVRIPKETHLGIAV